MIFIKAFIVGGIICVIGQLLIDLTKITPAKILVLFVCIGVVLGGAGIYDRLVDFAGCGATVPIIGFGNALAKGVRQSIDTDGFIGIFSGGLGACSVGVCVAIISGLIVAICTRSKDKK